MPVIFLYFLMYKVHQPTSHKVFYIGIQIDLYEKQTFVSFARVIAIKYQQ